MEYPVYRPRNERSKKLYEKVQALAMEGLTAREVAQHLDIDVAAATHRIAIMVRHGLLPKAAERKVKRRKASMTKIRWLRLEHSKPYGTLSQVVDCLTIDEAEWLFNNTPEGATVAEFVASIIVDAYEEDRNAK